MIRWTLFAVAVLLGIPVLLAVVGWFLPKDHVASRTITIAAGPAEVFAVIADIDALPTWRSDLETVERLPDDGRGQRYRERTRSGSIAYRIEVFEPAVRLVTRIADPTLPFGGTWTFDLAPSGTGTALTITEAGEVYNPIFRAMQKLFFSPTKTIETYQKDLAKRVGGQAAGR